METLLPPGPDCAHDPVAGLSQSEGSTQIVQSQCSYHRAMAVFKLRIKMSRKKKAKTTKTGKKSVWSDEKVDELIAEYEANEILYNKKCSGYANRDLREMTYAEIGKKFKVSGRSPNIAHGEMPVAEGQIMPFWCLLMYEAMKISAYGRMLTERLSIYACVRQLT